MRVLRVGLLIAFGALAGSAQTYASQNELTVVGTGDGLEMLREIGAGFSSKNPEVKLSIPPSIGSGGGIAAVSSDEERLARVARPLKESEQQAGLEYRPFAKIPSAFFVNSSVGLSSITAEDLYRVYSGQVRNWAELGGADLRVRLVRREDADSTLKVLRASMPGWDVLEISPRSKTAVTTQEAIETARNVKGAIAFGPYSRLLEQGLSVLKIDGFHPTSEDYPSAVTLALIYKDQQMDDQMKAFIDYASSDEARELITNYGGVAIGN